MKFNFLIYVLFTTLAYAELQGPRTITNNNAQDMIKTLENQQKPANDKETTVTTETNTEENDNPSDPTTSNERKSGKYIIERMKVRENAASTATGTTADGIEASTSKILQSAIFERLWNEQLLKKKIIEQIETIESKRSPKNEEITDPSRDEIEAHTLYEKAMDILSKPRSDKQVAYTYIRKAAEKRHSKARAELAWAHLLGHYVEFNFDFAASEFDELAKEGLPDANMGLAFLYSIGVGGKNISQPLALIHLTLAALGDQTFAQMALGYRYSYGINVPVSCEKSLTYYRKVAKKVAKKVTFASGPVVHRVRLLDELENSGSHETEIVDYYQLLADKGDVQSQVGLGQLYYQGGKAIEQDHQKALEYFTQAASSGNAISFAFLGKLYLEGSDFIKADNETAFKYFKKAADLGDPVGQSGLGMMYLNGLGVPKDALKALNFFTQAADQGWVDGQLQLGNMYFTGNGVKADYKLALKYFNLASQSGHVLAYYYLGVMHAYGMGMLRSCPTAVEFFKNVAERGRWSSNMMRAYSDYKNSRIDQAFMQYGLLAEMGYEVAQGNAAFLLDRNDVTIFHDRHEDLIRAFYYWKRAAAQGYSAAQVKLGDYYYYGWGTEIDFETAAALYRKASDQQYNAQAMFNLGYMHEKGLGMKKDWHLAKRLYDLAAETNADAKVPVAIALLKLQLLGKIEAIKESPYKFIFYMDENIAANWDLYMITILTLLLGFIMYTRRPHQNQPQEQQRPQVAEEQQLQNAAPAPIPAAAIAVAETDTAATTSQQTHQPTVNSEETKESKSGSGVETTDSPTSSRSISTTPNLLNTASTSNIGSIATNASQPSATSSTADPTD